MKEESRGGKKIELQQSRWIEDDQANNENLQTK
jgi:hypothetical protein